MIKKNASFIINEDNIFLNDRLQREDEIENLSNLIVSTSEPFTMSINADWGAGKTTFVKLWKEYLNKEHDIQSIYFSAWEDDFSKEPLISILGEINQYISNHFNDDTKVKEKFETVKSLGGKILKRGVPAFLKGVTAGIVDFDKGFEEAIGAIAETSARELIENYSRDKAITEEFNLAIQDLLTKIDGAKPFVIFIDELDRCRPTYAIELLERVKHIFGVKGLIFVLAIDKKQLVESIKSQYGNIDAASYLKRFIDLEYHLNSANKDDFCTFLYRQYSIDNIIKAKDIQNYHKHDLDHLSMLKYLIHTLDLTLREIEQAFIQINIVFKTMQPRLFESHFRIFIFLIVLKIKKQDLYFSLTNKTIPHQEVFDVVLDKSQNDSRRDLGIAIQSIVYATSATDADMQKIINQQEEVLQSISDKSSAEFSKQEWLISLLKHQYGQWGDYTLNKLVDTAIKKIEFVDKFSFEGLNDE